jgi:small conductance mechanosensitive channel
MDSFVADRLAQTSRGRLWLVAVFVPLLSVTLAWNALGQEQTGGGEANAGAEKTATEGKSAEPGKEGQGEGTADAKDKSEEKPEKVESKEDVEKVVEGAAKEAKQKAGEAVDALKSGDVSKAASRLGELFKTYGIPAIVAIVVLIIAYFFAAFLARLCSAPIRSRVDETLGRFVSKLVFYTLMICAILGVLQYFGIGITSFAAVMAAAGFAVGLAFQGTLSNFASGVLLLVFRPFKVGDVINAAGITAKVYEIDLFTTTFDTPDNRRIIVPNSAIASGTIENITHHQHRRVDVPVGVDYSADIQKTRETLTAAAESIRKFLVEGEGRGYQVALGDLNDSSVGWTVRFWTKANNFWTVKEELTTAVKNHLDNAGIGIPFPQMDVHVHQAG